MQLPERDQIDILLVDDDPSAMQVLSRALSMIGRHRFATNGVDALRLARQKKPDIVLMDAEMPGMGGFEVWQAMRAEPSLSNLPVIFVTSHSEAAMEEAGLALGAVDFIAKPVRPAIVAARVKTQLGLKFAQDKLREQAATDSLTQIANRRVLNDAVIFEWRRMLRGPRPLSIVMIDVDHFKRYNDLYGHLQGDQALVAVAKAMKTCACRTGDVVARYGGEEFVILMPETPRSGALQIAQEIQDLLRKANLEHKGSEHGLLTLSMGVACFDQDSAGWIDNGNQMHHIAERVTVEQILGVADKALYAAKKAGRAQSVMASVDIYQLAVDAPHSAAMPVLGLPNKESGAL